MMAWMGQAIGSPVQPRATCSFGVPFFWVVKVSATCEAACKVEGGAARRERRMGPAYRRISHRWKGAA